MLGDIVLNVLVEKQYAITGEVQYHDLSSLGINATRIDTENACLEVSLLENPDSNYQGSGETLKMIHLSFQPDLPYEGFPVARGGDVIISQYETFCQLLEKGDYTLHLFSNAAMQVSEK